nr:nucleotidyltransferase domain-containing protein [uncultured Sphingobacterium sp.]
MAKDYRKLVSELQTRMNPDNFTDVRLFGESVNKELLNVSGNQTLAYIKRSMQGVGQEYTNRSLEAGTNVKNHLRAVLTQVDYEYQGSVMTNTHLKGNSDIDLLVLSSKFYYSDKEKIQKSYESAVYWSSLNTFQINRLNSYFDNGSYQGNSYQDLKDNRLQSESKLKASYYKCDVSKSKCIQITNQNLHRDVDVVIAAWHKTFDGVKDADNRKNSIRVYDKDGDLLGRVESPFISIERINNKDSEVNGRLKKMIRFVKTLKYDADSDIKLSSFDINAICYNIPAESYSTKIFHELISVLLYEFVKIITNPVYRDSIVSVDGSEFIFKGNSEKQTALLMLYSELDEVANDLKNNLI